MGSQKQPRRPQNSNFRNRISKNKAEVQEQARQLNKEHEGPAIARRSIAPKTEYEQWRIWDSWEYYITEIHELDPRQIWVDLLDHKDVAPIFRSFWDHYVANSVKRRPVLGPNEYEEVQGLKSVVSVLGFWKALKSIADREVMEAKRLACREKAYYYTTWLQNGTQETGPLYAITQWISKDLADKYGLTRRQTFDKDEMTSNDIIVLLKVFWTRGIDIACTPSMRLAFHTVVLLSGIGGFRPGELMGIPYEDVRVALVRDPADRAKVKVVVHMKIHHSKHETDKVHRNQKDVLTFSVTLAPCPLVCLASLLIARALHDDAFEIGFESLQAILDQPKMGNVDYIPLHWKEGFNKKPIIPIAYFKFKELWDNTLLVAGFRQSERPYSMRVGAGGRLDGALEPAVRSYVLSNSENVFRSSYQPQHVRQELLPIAFGSTLAGKNDELFTLLQQASHRRDENAPIYPTKAQMDALEHRQDLKQLRQDYAKVVVQGRSKTSDPEANRLSAKIQWIRATLSDLLVQERRKEYFVEADRLRAQGDDVPDRARDPIPFKVHERESGEAAERIGGYLELDLKQPSRAAHAGHESVIFVDMLLAFQRRLHAQVNTLSGEACSKLGIAPVKQEPKENKEQVSRPHTCLICLGTYARRGTLTKHNTTVHCRKSDGVLLRPMTCPECKRRGSKNPPVIKGPIEWSNHVERFHGKDNAPSPPCGIAKLSISAGIPAAKLSLAKHQEQCLICEDVFEAGSGFQRHMTMIHEIKGFFNRPFDCPACKRDGTVVVIEDIMVWKVHVMKVHNHGGRFDHLLVPKRKLDESRDREQNDPARCKRQRMKLPANGLISVSTLHEMAKEVCGQKEH